MPPWLIESINEGSPLVQSWWPILLPSLLALVFLILWLRVRSRATKPELEEELRQARNELKRLKGDAIESNRRHAAEVEKLTRELEGLRAGRPSLRQQGP